MTHDLSAAELRAINDLRTATKRVAGALHRHGYNARAEDLINAVNDCTAKHDMVTGQTHKPIPMEVLS